MYFIFDHNGDIVGNPKGYRTFRGANRVANYDRRVTREIQDRFESRTNKEDKLIFAIRLIEG